MKTCALLSMMLLLTGCPEAPEHVKTANPGDAPGGADEGGPGQGPGNTPGAPPSGGDGPAGMTVADMKYTQEALAEMDAVSVSGELSCSTDGEYWVYIFPPPPGPDEDIDDSEPLAAIAGVKLDAPGDFSFKAPKGASGMLLAFQDLDADGVQKPGEPLFIGNDNQALDLSADNKDMSIDCDKHAVGMGGGPPPGTDAPPNDQPTEGDAPGEGDGEAGKAGKGKAGKAGKADGAEGAAGDLPPDGAAGPPPDGAEAPAEGE